VSLLFSYGTLRDPRTQLAVFGRVVALSADELIGFAPHVVEVRDEAFAAANGAIQTIVERTDRDGDRTPGAVLELTDAELAMADAYEPAGYERIDAPLASGRRAWVYASVKPTGD
jgi:hypothetical protein